MMFKILSGMAIRLKRSLRMNDSKDFIVDHPFIFCILTKNSGIIFVGRMTNINSVALNHIKDEL